ncbi:MAG TPA: GntR family transcriptional regulator [Gemmatimonadaceae bacterium]|nr:GntR family transcriptional regulator [Gemmatimonadaceae bacterium]
MPRKNVSTSRPAPASKRRSSGASERANRLYDSLRNMIVRGQLAPGARIVETEVAERFGVSRTPVRAAFQRLEREGYVIASPTHQARMTVAPLTREDVAELLEIVGELEGLAARSAARLDDIKREKLAKELAALNAEFRRAASARGAQPGRLYELDEKFHRRYVEAGAGSRLQSLHDAVKPQAERYIRMYIALLLDTVATAGTEHDVIVEAIRTGNSGAAQRAVQTNWRHAADRLVRAIDVMGEQGNW